MKKSTTKPTVVQMTWQSIPQATSIPQILGKEQQRELSSEASQSLNLILYWHQALLLKLDPLLPNIEPELPDGLQNFFHVLMTSWSCWRYLTFNLSYFWISALCMNGNWTASKKTERVNWVLPDHISLSFLDRHSFLHSASLDLPRDLCLTRLSLFSQSSWEIWNAEEKEAADRERKKSKVLRTACAEEFKKQRHKMNNKSNLIKGWNTVMRQRRESGHLHFFIFITMSEKQEKQCIAPQAEFSLCYNFASIFR